MATSIKVVRVFKQNISKVYLGEMKKTHLDSKNGVDLPYLFVLHTGAFLTVPNKTFLKNQSPKLSTK